MTPKRRSRSSGKRHRGQRPPASKQTRKDRQHDVRIKWALTAVVVIGAVAGILLLVQQQGRQSPVSVTADTSENITNVTDSSYRFRERRPTLSPNLFSGATAYAYQIAQDIPQVIDQLYCYCYCKENMGHKSLLTCYVDSHAANCDICQRQAQIAFQMTRQGKSPGEIQARIDSIYAKN